MSIPSFFSISYDSNGKLFPQDMARVQKYEMDVINAQDISDQEKSDILAGFYSRNRLNPGSYTRQQDEWDSRTDSDHSSLNFKRWLIVIWIILIMIIIDKFLANNGIQFSLLNNLLKGIWWAGYGAFKTCQYLWGFLH